MGSQAHSVCLVRVKEGSDIEKIKEEMDAIKSLVTEYDIEPLSVPFLTENEKYERNLVIIKREKVLYQFG